MNDALRFLAKILRKYGYDIKRHYQYNLLPINNIESFNSVSGLYNSDNNEPGHKEESLDVLFICLRTCLKNNPDKIRPPEITGSGHEELVFRCINSLINSINHAQKNNNGTEIKLIIFDDHSDEEHQKVIENICEKSGAAWEIRTTQSAGQGNSLYEQFQFARTRNGLCYFCEDDYLHEESAVSEMLRFYKQVFLKCNTHLVIHPQEHEFLFTRYVYPSYILLGENRHWRTISHATHTMFTHSCLVSKYWQYFENTRFVGDKKNRRLGVESRTTNHLFEHVPGFAPVPALAAHMQVQDSLPPFFNWRALWEKNRLE